VEEDEAQEEDEDEEEDEAVGGARFSEFMAATARATMSSVDADATAGLVLEDEDDFAAFLREDPRFLVLFAALDLADAAALADGAERPRFLAPLRPPSRLRRAATAEIIEEFLSAEEVKNQWMGSEMR
jgi:hypothetical protein